MTELEKQLMVIGGIQWCIDHFDYKSDVTDNKKLAALQCQRNHIEQLLDMVDINLILDCCQKDIYSLL